MPASGSQKNKQGKAKQRKSSSPGKTAAAQKHEKAPAVPVGNEASTKEEVSGPARAPIGSTSSNSSKTFGSSKVDLIGPNRFQVLSYDQVKCLHRVIEKSFRLVPVTGSPYPPITVCLRSIVTMIRKQLTAVDITVKDNRLSAKAASQILDLKVVTSRDQSEIDLVFSVDIIDNCVFQRIKGAIFQIFMNIINKRLVAASSNASKKTATKPDQKSEQQQQQQQQPQPPPITHDQFNANYVQKLARVVRSQDPTADCWSIISVGMQPKMAHKQRTSSTSVSLSGAGTSASTKAASTSASGASATSGAQVPHAPPTSGVTLNLRFIDRMRRQYEFTVDSFQIILDTILNFYSVTKSSEITQNLFPTVVVESVSGSFQEAYRHLKDQVIFTKNTEEICGGGLLRYCDLIAQGYKQDSNLNTRMTEKYMCSRFFIDYPDICSQHNVIVVYIDRACKDQEAKTKYLTILFKVVSHSTVCLMTHERRQTFNLIQNLLHTIINEIEIKKSSVQLDDLGTQSWVLDQVFFGTLYFPQQFYLTGPMTDSETNMNDPNFFICLGAEQSAQDSVVVTTSPSLCYSSRVGAVSGSVVEPSTVTAAAPIHCV